MINTDKFLDAKGLACPMPIVKTKKAMKDLLPGQVIEVQATDQGSTADLKAWADSIGHDYLGTIEREGVLTHYLRKTSNEEIKEEAKHPYVVSNDELKEAMDENDSIVIVDVREQAEYVFKHIPKAISIPLSELEGRLEELNAEDQLYIICRSGNRSDVVAQKLTEKGYGNVKNVVPGMGQWEYETEGLLTKEA